MSLVTFFKPRACSPAKPVDINLALQGGGSKCAYQWGYLVRLLEAPEIRIRKISGTSGGGVNGAIIANALNEADNEEDGRKQAIHNLNAFWRDVILEGKPVMDAIHRMAAWRGFDLDAHWPEIPEDLLREISDVKGHLSQAFHFASGQYVRDAIQEWHQHASAWPSNALFWPALLMSQALTENHKNFTPEKIIQNQLSNLIQRHIDPANLNNDRNVTLITNAVDVTDPSTHFNRNFGPGEHSISSLVASCYLVEFGGSLAISHEGDDADAAPKARYYNDGGYMCNPPLQGSSPHKRSDRGYPAQEDMFDRPVLMIATNDIPEQIRHVQSQDTGKDAPFEAVRAKAIENFFTLAAAQDRQNGGVDCHIAPMRNDGEISDSNNTVLNTDPDYIATLYQKGYEAADKQINEELRCYLGRKSTYHFYHPDNRPPLTARCRKAHTSADAC